MPLVFFLAGTLAFAIPSCMAASIRRPLGSDMTLWYRQPAQQWTEALPIGNGRLGAMVFGDARQERLQLNEDTLYTGEPGAVGVVPLKVLSKGKRIKTEHLEESVVEFETKPGGSYLLLTGEQI